MALTGQAKTEYQKEYMRRRRAGLGKPPKAEREPTWSELRRVRRHKNPRSPGFYFIVQLLAGLDRTAPDFELQAVRRIREHKAALKAKANERKNALTIDSTIDSAIRDARLNGREFSEWPRKVYRCMFCDNTSENHKMSGNEYVCICLDCARESVSIMESNQPPAE
jgi:hypothetical protein